MDQWGETLPAWTRDFVLLGTHPCPRNAVVGQGHGRQSRQRGACPRSSGQSLLCGFLERADGIEADTLRGRTQPRRCSGRRRCPIALSRAWSASWATRAKAGDPVCGPSDVGEYEPIPTRSRERREPGNLLQGRCFAASSLAGKHPGTGIRQSRARFGNAAGHPWGPKDPRSLREVEGRRAFHEREAATFA